MQNSLLIRALLKQQTERTPVWVMRQAGRYLPEYREVRSKFVNFVDLCQNPEAACEVTLQPIRRFPLDASIIFSDILTIPDAMGLGLAFAPGEGPYFNKPLTTVKDIENLPLPEAGSLQYVMDAITLTRQELPQAIPLLGFCGSPWTLATYMVEGKSSKNFNKVRKLMYSQPQAMHLLLSKLADACADYLNQQIIAGANALMIFDSWGGLLSPTNYQAFSAQYMAQIIAKLAKEHNGSPIPTIVFTKGGGQWLEITAATGCQAVGLDWTTDIKQARACIGDKVALQGNLDPAALYSEPESIKQQVKKIIDDFGANPGHVFNLGHGIYPDVKPEHLQVMLEAVHEYSAAVRETA